jgi:hypothetical protein
MDFSSDRPEETTLHYSPIDDKKEFQAVAVQHRQINIVR